MLPDLRKRGKGLEVSASEQPDLDRPSGTTIAVADPEIVLSLRGSIGLAESELVTLSQLLPGLTVHFSVEPQTYGPDDDLSALLCEVQVGENSFTTTRF